MSRLIKVALVVMLSFTILSCEMFDNSAGSFHIRFQWPEDAKPDFAEKEYHLWVVLEHWEDGDDEKASILMQTAPTKFDAEGKAKVDLSDVQYGENFVIKVEIRGSTKTQDRVLYFGRSELFTFKSKDKDKEVKVKLQTQATPGTGSQDDNGFSIKIVQNGKEVTKINDTTVSVRIKVVNGTRVIIANSLAILEQYLNDNTSVTDGVIEKPVAELTSVGEEVYDLESWDLNTGLDLAGTDGGERVVFGKLLNDEGYVSETAQASVAVDVTAPVVINPTVSPNPAKLGDLVTATFSFSEDIDPETLELDWDGLSFTVDEGAQGNLIKYTYTVMPSDEEKAYSLKGSARDIIGNGPVEFNIGDLQIDRTSPTISDEEVFVTDDKSSIRGGDSVTVKFKVSEEIEGVPEVTVDGKKFSRVGEETEPYQFSYLLSDSDIDGTKTILVSLTDKARNSDVVELEQKVVFDLSAPEIVNPTVTPSGDPGLAALGTKIEVRFNISETVDELKFYVNGTENTNTFTQTVDGLTYIYSRTVDAGDSVVDAYEFSVSAVDSAGNELSQQTLGTVNVDVVKPEITQHSISTPKVKLLESFNVTLDVSEALSSLSLLVGSKDISSGCTLSTTVDSQYICTHIANEDSDEGDGVKQFSVMMTDLAGNSSTVQLKDGSGANETIEYDVTPPDVVNPVIAPEKANLDSTIDVRFSFTENVENLTINWGGLEGKFTRDNEEANKKLFIYKHKVTDEDEEGTFPVTVTSAFDEAGNEISEAILIGNVEIDNSAPEIFNTEISVNDDISRSYVVTNDTVKIVFEVHEEISDYTARIGLLKIESCTEEVVTEGTKYTCSYASPTADDGEGTKDVTVEVKDLAGNAKSYPIGQVVFDMSFPEISSAIVIPEQVNLSSSDVQVKFSFSEDVSVLSENVTMVADPPSADPLTLSCNTGTDHKKQFTCTATFDGVDTRVADYAVSVDATDKAGNKVNDLAVGTVQIDREKPTITVSNVDPVSVKSGESFDVTFTVNETLAAVPIVKIADKELPGTECSEVSANSYKCTHEANVDGDESDGTKSITVNLRDPAGNISTEILPQTVSYDATRPSIINTVILPEADANQYDSNIQVRFSFSEPINYPASFDFKVESLNGYTLPAFSCSDTGSSSQSFMCEGTYPDTNTDVDTLTFSVKASDIAGNTLLESDAYEVLGTLDLDRDPAGIVFGDILPASVNKTTTEVTVEFTVDEELSENPRVYLGSILSTTPESSSVSGDSTTYLYKFTDLFELGDGFVSVVVEVADSFGNNSSNDYYNAITVDRTSPSVMTSSLSPLDINVQTEDLQVSLTFSEPVDSFDGSGITSSPSVFSSWTCQNPAGDDQSFICTHSLSSLALSDVSHEFFVTADDLAGNTVESAPVSIGSVNVDKTYPTATFTSVSPLAVNKAETTLTVSFTVSEDLDRDPIVKIGSDLFSSTPASNSGYDYTYEFTNLGDLSDGNKDVEVVLTDLSGNEKETVYGTQLDVDRTSPTVTPGGVAPAVANENTETVTVFFSFSEAVSGFGNGDVTVSPDGVLTAYNCTNPTSDNQSYKCVFDLSAVSPADGTYEFFVNATDTAGNPMESAPQKVGEFLLDTAGVEITFNDVTPTTVNSSTGSVSVTFTVGEVPGDNPVVKIGTELSSSTPDSVTNGGLTYTYVFSSLAALSDGEKNVFANVEDDSGNVVTGTWSGTIDVDKTEPSVISSSVGPDNVIVLTEQISISLSFSEAVSGFSGSDITVSPSGILAAASCSSPSGDHQTFICTIDTSSLTEAANGNYEFYATATDVAGNPMSAPQSLGDVTIDRKIPSFTVDTFSPAQVSISTSQVSIAFTVSEELNSNPQVRLGSEKVLTAYNNKAGLTYTYVFNDLAGITDGQKNFNISFEDLAGNYYDNDATGPVFDRTRPYVVAGGVAPTEINNYTQNVNVSFTFSEPVASFTSSDISVSPSGTFPTPVCSDNDGNRQSFTCSYNISSIDVGSGTYTFSVAADDDFGNAINPSPEAVGSVDADTVDPECTFTSVAPLAVNSGTTGITVSFSSNEVLRENPVVKIGSDLFSSTPKTKVGLDYTYEFTNLSTLTDGSKYVTVVLTDNFGNEHPTVYGTEIVVDRTAPTVTPGGVAPSTANENTDTVTVFFSFSEAVDSFGNANVTTSPSGVLTVYNCTNPTGDDQSFKCVFDISAVSASDGIYEFFVDAVDVAGNNMEEAPYKVGEVLLDTEGVNVTFDSVSPVSVNSSTGSVSVVFTTGEVPGDTPVVKIGTELTMTSYTSVANSGKTFTYTFDSLNALTDGLKNVFVEVEDSAGNSDTVTWAGTIDVDRTLPSVITSSVGPDNVASHTDQITLNISFNEALSGFSGSDISVVPSGVLGTPVCVSPGGDNQTFSCTIDTSSLTQSANGDYQFYATGTDLAGNTMSAPELLGDVTVDRKIPSFTVDTFSPAEANSSTSQVSITFTVSEALKHNPKVILGSEKVLTTYSNKTDLTYTYVFNDLAGIPDGQKNFNISIEDTAGNYFEDAVTGPFFDRTAPHVVSGSVSPDEINMYTEAVNVNFTFSEPVDSFSASSVTVTPGGVFPAPVCTDNDGARQSYTCTYDISSTTITSEISAFDVTAVDDYGNTINPNPTEIGIATADIEKPTCTAVNVSPLTVNAETGALSIVFTVDSTLAEDPDVFIGPDVHLDAPTSVTGDQYTYSITNFDGIPDGEKVIRIEMKDTFGNMGTSFNSQNVTFDRTRPMVVNSFAAPSPVNEATAELNLRVSFSEAIDTYDLGVAPSLDAYFNACSLSGDEVELECSWSMPVPATDIDGNYTFRINAVDKNGNYILATHAPVDLLGGDPLVIDRTKPDVTLDAINVFLPTSAIKDPQIAKVGDIVIAQLSFNEDLRETPIVRLGGREMSVNGGGDCLGGTCTFRLTVIAADGDGSKALTVEAEDVSGNVRSTEFLDAAEFDVTEPVVTYASLTPEYAKEGDEMLAVFYFSEDIAPSTLLISSVHPFTKDTGMSTDREFYYRYTVTSGTDEGSFSFSVKASDPVGNISYSDTYHEIGTSRIDRTKPQFTSNVCHINVSSGYSLPSGLPAVSYGHVINADCNFSFNEMVESGPVLRIGGYEFTSTSCGGGYSHCYFYPVSGSEGDGYKVLTAEVVDLAGNFQEILPEDGVSSNPQQVAFDFTAPQLVYYMVYRDPELEGSVEGQTVHLSAYHPVSKETVSLNIQLFSDEIVNPAAVSLVSVPSGLSLGSPVVNDHIVKYEKPILITDSGAYSFSLTWEDMLGNSNFTPIVLDWDINIENSNSDSADVDMDKIEYVKVPYGSESTGGSPRYSLVGEAGAVKDSDVTLVSAYSVSGSYAGMSTVEGDGSFSIPSMSSGNVDKIYINPIRRSGSSMMPEGEVDPYNDLLEVENMKYIATMGYKTAGSDLNNPNDWYETKTNAYSVEYVGTNTSFAVDGDNLSRLDSTSLESGTASKWMQAGRNEHPEASYRTTMCYDSKRGKIVLFGGVYNLYHNETWEWFDGKWSLAVVDDPEGDGQPEPMVMGHMAYDSKRGVCVYYGGADSNGIKDQTWEWNGRSWRRRFPSDPEGDGNPLAIYGGGFAYDTHRNVTVLAAGVYGAASDSVYEYDGESWKEMPMETVSPSSDGGKMVYDKARRVMVFVGGGNQGDVTLEYAGQKFTEVCGGTTGCSGLAVRDDAMMAYDANREVVVYFGGDNGSSNTNTIHEWNGTSWVAKSPSGDKPAIREEGSMVYHEGRKTVILYGGRNGSTKYNDTWEWDGTKWTRLSPMNGTSYEYPQAKTHYAAAYDEYRKVLILHGGMTASATVSNQTWEWNGYSWKRLYPSTSPYRYGHTLVYDSSSQKLLMFGGRDDTSTYKSDVYEWSGTNWVLRTPLSGSIHARMYHSAAYDSARNKMIIYGGQVSSGTKVQYLHEWDNATRTWVWQANWGPEARIHAGMVYDPVKNRTILFGGKGGDDYAFGNTWEYRGDTRNWYNVVSNPWTWGDNYPGPGCPSSESNCWENSSGIEYPVPRYDHIMVYDPVMKKTVVSGGMVFQDWTEGYYFVAPDSWTYDSSTTSWQRLNVINENAFEEKTKLYNHEGYYNTDKNEVASWGGVKGMEDSQLAYPQTNILRTGASEVPSQMVTVPLDAIGLTEEHAWRDIKSISLSVVAGATVKSGASCADVNGVVLYGWADDHWSVLDQSPSSKSSMSELTFSVNKPEIIQMMLNGEFSELYFKIEAKGVAGCVDNDESLLAVDYAEITVDVKEDSIKDRYYISNTARTWDAARAECIERGMDLVVITSKREYDIVTSLLPASGYYWIGLHEPSVDGEWEWVNGLSAWNGDEDGGGVTWTNWRVVSGSMDRPASLSLNCAQLYVYNGNYIFYDQTCTLTRRAICEKRDYSYSGITGDKSSHDTACTNLGGKLVSINSEIEENAIWPFVSGISVHHYIGLTNSTADNIYVWNDGEICWDGNNGSNGVPYSYSHWSPGQPDNSSQDCVAYRPGSSYESWSDYACTFDYFGGICEF